MKRTRSRRIATAIECTRHGADDSDGGEDTLVRAANLIDQLGDPTTFWIVWS
jgi:hypothetical protein